MSGLLNIGTRALQANQAALQTAGNNIANVNTAGYSRQNVVLQQVKGQYTGSGYIGKGVDIVTIERNHSEFLTRQSVLSASVSAMDGARSSKLMQLQDLFQGGASGLGAAVNDMLNAFGDVASAPTDLTARNVVITRADELAARMRGTATQLNDLEQSVQKQLAESVSAINTLTGRIAAANEEITRAIGAGQPPNDLLDQRDYLVAQLNTHVQTSSVAAQDGSISVFVGSQALVLGNSTAKVKLGADEFGDPNKTQLFVQRGALTTSLDENSLGGGSIAGLMRFKNNDLTEARNLLGRMAISITAEVNAQHRLGLDLDGNAGGSFFTPRVLHDGYPAAGNAGNAVVGVAVADAKQLVASDYRIRFGAGTSVDVVRVSDGKTTSLAGPMPVTVDGLTFSVGSGTSATGDQFMFKPFAEGAAGMQMAFTSPRALAVANPVEARTGTGNLGAASVTGITARSANTNLTQPVTITFTSATTFNVTGTGTGNPTGVAYVPGAPISYNGWTLTMKGAPANGDSLVVQAATPGFATRNAGNADALLALRDAAVFDGAPLSDGYASLMAQVGVRTQSAKYSADVSSSIAASIESDRTGVTGVNLDEEAAKLIQFQQAYQASSKMIQIAQNIFDTLIQGMAR